MNTGSEAIGLLAENIKHSFRAKTRGSGLAVLAGLSVEVKPGELVALVGPSGCGKSTLLNIISGLLVPQSGRIVIGDRNVTGKAGNVGYMMQDDLLLPWRTILENVILGAEIIERDKKKARVRANELMDRFDLAGFEHYYPSALSGGMRQRASFMRAVLCDREVLLLDEPFQGLDALTKSHLHEWLLDLWKEFGLTILFVTHDPEEAIFLSDRTYVLSRRPTVIRRVIDVDLPRPRKLDLLNTPTFNGLKQQVLESLWEEDIHAA